MVGGGGRRRGSKSVNQQLPTSNNSIKVNCVLEGKQLYFLPLFSIWVNS